MPCSEVNRPSVILEPVSRGFLISGFEIFILFVGLSMVFGQQITMYTVGLEIQRVAQSDWRTSD